MTVSRGLVPEAVEQRFESADVVDRLGDVGPLVGPEALGHQRIVVAPGAGVDLQRQAVVDAHGGHFDEHLAAEQLGVARPARPRHNPTEEVLGFSTGEIGGGG